MIKVALLTITVTAAGVLSFAGSVDAASRAAQETTTGYDTGRCFNRCLAYRGYRPASMRVGFCSRRCQ